MNLLVLESTEDRHRRRWRPMLALLGSVGFIAVGFIAVGFIAVGFIAAGFIAAHPSTARARTPDDEEFLVRTKGLVRIGHHWVVPLEVRLRKQLDKLPALESAILAGEKNLQQAIDHNAAAWRQVRTVEAALVQLGEATQLVRPGSSQRNKIEKEIRQKKVLLDRLRHQAVDPAKLGGVPKIRSIVIGLINDRNALATLLFWIRQAVTTLDVQYQTLRNEREVIEALARLGGSNGLGPARNYEKELKQLGRYQRRVDLSHVPLYLDSGRMRVGLIINEECPATFTWRKSSEPTLITASLAEAAGIVLPPTAPRITMVVDRKRRLTVRQVNIPYVRLGRYVFRDVSAFILPPEGEDLGSQIGPVALRDYRVLARPELLRLSIETPDP